MSTQLPGESTAPLSDRERRLLNRLLSDSSLYPQSFKSWLVPFLEISDMDLPMANVHGLLDQLDRLGAPLLTRLPSGTVLLFDGPDAPDGTQFHPDAAVQAQAPGGLRFIIVT